MTKLIYLSDSYLDHATAHVLEIRTLEDGRTAIICDQTIFYPQGGGQPFDTGIIQSQQAKFLVKDTRMDKDGIVYHIGTFERGQFTPQEIVELAIDMPRRIHHATLHSAGHLIDCAIEQLNIPVKPTKGYHFPEGPYVEYEGEIANAQEIMQPLQEKIDALVAADLPIEICELSYEQALERGITAPEGKTARIVCIKGFEACGCGGTHVTSTKQIGHISIRKIKSKGGNTRISYELLPQ